MLIFFTQRVLTTFEFDDPNPIKFMQPFFESFSVAYKTLHEGKSITCAATKVAYDPVGAPVAVVIDVCVFNILTRS